MEIFDRIEREFTASDIAEMEETDLALKVDELRELFKTEFARQKKFIKEYG